MMVRALSVFALAAFAFASASPEVIITVSRGDVGTDAQNVIRLSCYRATGNNGQTELLTNADFFLNETRIEEQTVTDHALLNLGGSLMFRIEPETEGVYTCSAHPYGQSAGIKLAAFPEKQEQEITVRTTPESPIDIDIGCAYQPGALHSLHTIRWDYFPNATERQTFYQIQETNAGDIGPYTILSDFALRIEDARREQSGVYRCRVDTEGKPTGSYGPPVVLNVQDGRDPRENTSSPFDTSVCMSVTLPIIVILSLMSILLMAISLYMCRCAYQLRKSNMLIRRTFTNYEEANPATFDETPNHTSIPTSTPPMTIQSVTPSSSSPIGTPCGENSPHLALTNQASSTQEYRLLKDMQNLLAEAGTFLKQHYCEINDCTCNAIIQCLKFSRDALHSALHGSGTYDNSDSFIKECVLSGKQIELNSASVSKPPLAAAMVPHGHTMTPLFTIGREDEPSNASMMSLPYGTVTTPKSFPSCDSLQLSPLKGEKCPSKNLPLLLHELKQAEAVGRKQPSLKVSAVPLQKYKDQTAKNFVNATNTLPRLTAEALCSSSMSSVPFMAPIDIMRCNSKGGIYTNDDHKFSIEVPQGAIHEGVTISIEVGVTLYGPFEFPQDCVPVSPIVWMCVHQQPSFKFLKPVIINLPHYLDLVTKKDCEGVRFLKAGHNMNSKKQYSFQPSDEPYTIKPGVDQGTLYATHFCYLCLGTNKPKTKPKKYCVIPTQPIKKHEVSWTTSFCVAYLLPTCIEAVRQQCKERQYNVLSPKPFKFIPSTNPTLKIDFERYPRGGWLLSAQNCIQISADEVDFTEDDYEEMETMHKELMYPPRFILEVTGSSAQVSSIAQIKFDGAIEPLSFEFPLELSKEVCRSLALLPAHPSVARPHSLVSSASTLSMTSKSEASPNDSALSLSPSALPPDAPTDVELEELTKEILARLGGGDWVKLQSYLNIPEDVMVADVLTAEKGVRRQLMKMLKIWRDQEECTRESLAKSLTSCDCRLKRVADKLVSLQYSLNSATSTPSDRGRQIAVRVPKNLTQCYESCV